MYKFALSPLLLYAGGGGAIWRGARGLERFLPAAEVSPLACRRLRSSPIEPLMPYGISEWRNQ